MVLLARSVVAGLVLVGAVLLHPAEARAPLSVRIGNTFYITKNLLQIFSAN